MSDSAFTSLFDDESAQFTVLVNPDGQYSLWPAALDIPRGWTEVPGELRSRAECLAWIDTHWADLRPGLATGARPMHPASSSIEA